MGAVRKILVALVLASVWGAAAVAQGSLIPVQLRCEYLVNPVGIDVAKPRLGWILEAEGRNRRQTAYELRVASTPEALTNGGDRWESGRVESSEQNQIEYAGSPLISHDTCYWSVRVWDEKGVEGPWAAPAQWTMGMISPEDWKAQWITAPEGVAQPEDQSGPLPLFRRDFHLSKPVRRALLYACGLGFQELRLNGARIGKGLFEPGWTNYRKTCLYTADDVTALLCEKDNTLGIMLGNGMYNVPGGRYTKFTGTFGQPKAILQLHLEYTDGTTEERVTDHSWRAARGPINFSCIYGGEDYDAREEKSGWDQPGFDASAWSSAVECASPGGKLSSASAPPIKVMETYPSVQVTRLGPGSYIYDFGKNFSGRPKIRLQGPRGATVKLVPGEVLDASRKVTQSHSGGPMWFSYTLKGEGTEDWSPQFTYYGFQYIQVEGASPASAAGEEEGLPRIEALSGEFTYSSAPVAGSFECGNPLMNQIHQIILASIRSNLQSVLTDCPHREKLGWLEVSHLLADGLVYNFDLARFYAKVQQDMADAQLDNGLVPDIAPEYTVFSAGFRDSPEWGTASVINPWNVWLMYGDRRLLETHYDMMRRYVDYLASTASANIVSHGLGDWYDIGPGAPGESKLTSKGVTATAVYYQALCALQQAAALLGKTEDAASLAERAAEVRTNFNNTYLRLDQGNYDRNSQTANAMPLVLGLVEDSHRAAVSQSLSQNIIAADYRVTAGDVGFSYLVRALTDTDQGELLYKMVCQNEGPGYAFQIARGATSLSEAWDADPGSSHNHCMLGHAEGWFYRGLGGIRMDPSAPGFRHFLLQPQFPQGLDWVKVGYDSIRGMIRSEWKVEQETVAWSVQIPPNTAATLYVPVVDASNIAEGGLPLNQSAGLSEVRAEEGHVRMEAGSGSYQLQWTLSAASKS